MSDTGIFVEEVVTDVVEIPGDQDQVLEVAEQSTTVTFADGETLAVGVLEDSVHIVEIHDEPAAVIAVVEEFTEVVEIVTEGPQGPPGAPGGQFYEHTQATPAATWVITHNIGHPVHVSLLDASGQLILTTAEQHPPYNVTTLTFPTPTVGLAYLS